MPSTIRRDALTFALQQAIAAQTKSEREQGFSMKSPYLITMEKLHEEVRGEGRWHEPPRTFSNSIDIID